VAVSCATSLATAVAAGQEGDEDVEEGCDAVDDGSQDAGNAVDDGHETVADCSEDRLNTRNDGTHFDSWSLVLVLWVVLWVVLCGV